MKYPKYVFRCNNKLYAFISLLTKMQCPNDLTNKQRKVRGIVTESVGVYVGLCLFSPSLSPFCSTFQPSCSYLYWLRTGRITALRGQFLELWDTDDQRDQRADIQGDDDDNNLSMDRGRNMDGQRRLTAAIVDAFPVENFLCWDNNKDWKVRDSWRKKNCCGVLAVVKVNGLVKLPNDKQ